MKTGGRGRGRARLPEDKKRKHATIAVTRKTRDDLNRLKDVLGMECTMVKFVELFMEPMLKLFLYNEKEKKIKEKESESQ